VRLCINKKPILHDETKFRYYPESSIVAGRGKLLRAEIGIISRHRSLSLEIHVSDNHLREGLLSSQVQVLVLDNVQVRSKNFTI
jgi:hypothetical protein